MRKREKRRMNCFRAQRISSALSLAGVAVGAFSVFLGQAASLRWPVFTCAAGFLLLIAGLTVGWFGLACPHCGEPLYEFPHLVREIPARCPHCGRELEETKGGE